MNTNYYYKMLKYKNKYLELKKILHGGLTEEEKYIENVKLLHNFLRDFLSNDLTENLKLIDIDYFNNKFYDFKVIFNDPNILQIMNKTLNVQSDELSKFKHFIVTNFDILSSSNNKTVNDFICAIFKKNISEDLTGGGPEIIPSISLSEIIKRKRHKDIIAEGGNGKIYKDDDKKAIKIINRITPTELDLEVEMYTYFYGKKIGPQIFEKFHSANPGDNQTLIEKFNHYFTRFCSGICDSVKKDVGGYTLKLYTSDIHDLLSHENLFEWINFNDKLEMLERRIIYMLNILYDSASEKTYFCTDIKYKNMLVDYKISSDSNNLITEETDIVLHDFDKTHCQKDINSLSKIDKENMLSVMKSLAYLTLILIQIEINIKRKSECLINLMNQKTVKFINLFLFKNKLEEIEQSLSEENINKFHNDIYHMWIIQPLYYIYSYYSFTDQFKDLPSLLGITDRLDPKTHIKNLLASEETYKPIYDDLNKIVENLKTIL